MYNDRVLRGNTYAILKNANRNIDTNIKPPTLPQKIEIYKEVYILFRKSISCNKIKTYRHLELSMEDNTYPYKLRNMSKYLPIKYPLLILKHKLIFTLIDHKTDFLFQKKMVQINRHKFQKTIQIFLISKEKSNLFAKFS